MTIKNDITELAQSLKAAAKKATKGRWVAFTDTATKTFAVHTPNDKRCENIIKWAGFDCQKNAKANAEFIALANPANALALVEALEKAQTDCNEYASSERAVAVKSVELQDEIYGLKARIAELESRTVTVKPMRPGHITVGGEKIGIYMRDEVDEFMSALAAAGIKWEAE
ncbi:ead/Ea22-like family protein [Klebsiella michiganensis]|nr:ead/Ea22-like family protein [Klebsiella michiganensis]MBG2685411.1 ead/Ea22-like family protein [Klebsiella michiganensis]